MIRTGRLFITFAFVLTATAAGAAPVRLARTPDFHAGKIAFSYLGDIWVVDEDGSNPHRLTDNVARDINPRFSPDGKWIAFSSPRFGNYDVFVIPAGGGTARRLTFHSGNDEVVGWTPDSKQVVFRASRGDGAFPGVATLYQVPVEGGRETSLPTDWGWWGSYSADGKRFAFNRHPSVLDAQALPRQLCRRHLGGRPGRQDRHAGAGRGQLQPLLAHVRGQRRDLLRGRSPARRKERQAGQPRGAAQPQQHLQGLAQGRTPSRCR